MAFKQHAGLFSPLPLGGAHVRLDPGPWILTHNPASLNPKSPAPVRSLHP